MIFKIIGVGITTVVIGLLLKQYKPEIAILSNVCGSLLIVMLLIDGFENIINELFDIETLSTMEINIVSPIIKMIGIGYVTEFTSDLAEDSGNKTISNKVIIGGKIAVCVVALPIIKVFVSSIISLI